MEYDEPELAGPEPYWLRAERIVDELCEIATTLRDNPELAKLADPVEAAERMLDDLAALDALADLGKLDEL